MAEKTLKVVIVGDASNATRELRKFESQSSLSGKIVSGAFKAVAIAAGVATTAIGALFAGIIKGGISRALDIETARVQLDRMGYSLSEINGLVKTVSDTFDGTVFTTPEGFKLTQLLLGAGQALEDIPGMLTTVADFAAHANVDLDRMGQIFLKIQAGGRVTGKELMQLSEAGVALAPVAAALGMTERQMRELVRAGGLTSEMFFEAAAAAEMYQGAAKASGDTTRGAAKNIISQLSRLGEILVQPYFGEGGPMVRFFKSIRQSIIDVRPEFTAASEAISARLIPALAKATVWFETGGLNTLIGTLTTRARELFTQLRSGEGPLAKFKDGFLLLGGPLAIIARDLLPLIRPLLDAIIPPLAELANGLAPALASILGFLVTNVLPGFVVMLDTVIGWLSGNRGLVSSMVAAGVAFKVFTAIMAVNPFILIAAAVIGLVALIITNWDKIKTATTAVRDWIVNTWNTVVGFFRNMPARISAAVGGLFDGLKNAFRNAINWIIGKWNNFKIELRLPAILGGGTIRIDTPNIPRFHQGGEFRAPTPGGEGLAILKDRERILTPGQAVGGTSIYLTVQGSVVTENELIDAIQRGLQHKVRRNGALGLA